MWTAPSASAPDDIRPAGLIEWYGADISSTNLLRHLTASCQNRCRLGALLARKYQHLCIAAITLPPPIKQIPSVPPGVLYTIKVWNRIGSILELHLATIYPPSLALAALDATCQECR